VDSLFNVKFVDFLFGRGDKQGMGTHNELWVHHRRFGEPLMGYISIDGIPVE
jgi:hypothetical protein